jgi:hypothetical protein
MTGEKYGRLRVTERAENTSKGQACWECLCECGNTTIVRGFDLRSGNTVSCGCFQKETIEKQHANGLIHGHARRGKTSKVYYVWKNARHGGKTRLSFPAFLEQESSRGNPMNDFVESESVAVIRRSYGLGASAIHTFPVYWNGDEYFAKREGRYIKPESIEGFSGFASTIPRRPLYDPLRNKQVE